MIQQKKRGRRKKRVCQFCTNKTTQIDYKSPGLRKDFMSERGKILPRRISGACAKHQRAVTQAIKRARHMALLPFSVD